MNEKFGPEFRDRGILQVILNFNDENCKKKFVIQLYIFIFKFFLSAINETV